MGEKRQLELYLLRFLPHALRDDFVTVGLLLLESDGGFAELRFTHDWRMLQCVAPAKAVLTEDPAKEMEVLSSMYLVPIERGERVQQRTGRAAIVEKMREAFANAGVLELMKRNLDVDKYTGMGDPSRIDFGYRVGNDVRMFHAVSVATNADQALALAYRYSRIEVGMRREQMQASLTAVLDREITVQEETARFAIGMLEQNSVRVRTVEEMAEIAGEVRRELRA